MNSATPEPNSFLQFWVIIGFIAMVVGQIISIIVMLANRKQQREVSFLFEPASKKEFDQFTATSNANFVQIREEMKQDRADNQRHASERSKTLFTEMKDTRVALERRINRLSLGVAALCARQNVRMPSEEDEA